MKNLREMTDDQVVQIGKMAMNEVFHTLWLQSGFRDNFGDYKFRIVREAWDKEKDGTEYLVIRSYLDGCGDKIFFHIWENAIDQIEEHDRIQVDVVFEGADHHCDSIVPIVKKLIEWEFV